MCQGGDRVGKKKLGRYFLASVQKLVENIFILALTFAEEGGVGKHS